MNIKYSPKKVIYLLFLFALALGCAAKKSETEVKKEEPPSETLTEQVSEEIETKLNTEGNPSTWFTFNGEKIQASGMLPRFYESRNFLPAWSNNNGLSGQAIEYAELIQHADREGLRPSDYYSKELETAIYRITSRDDEGDFPKPNELAELELLLTHSFFLYGSHLLNGRINPEQIDAGWVTGHMEVDLVRALDKALETGSIEEEITGLLPSQTVYSDLKTALPIYREFAEKGGWQSVTAGPKMEKGYRGERVILLRERLIAERYLKPSELSYPEIHSELQPDPKQSSSENDSENSFEEQDMPPPSGYGADQPNPKKAKERDPSPFKRKDMIFDTQLELAVRNFQRTHGLSVDGVVGPSTLKALNVPAKKRVSQIKLNMERLRWLPQNMGNRYILVNVAGFHLYAYENNRPSLDMKVVVGKAYWNTPTFSDTMTYVELNPYWNIPKSIFADEILPKLRKDPDYLASENIQVLTGWGSDAVVIDPFSINWQEVSGKDFRYRLRQRPGPKNPLGRIKFMFPNQYNIYLHDTPSKNLFKRAERTFSHGCIRVEKPIELAGYVFAHDPKWTEQKIESRIRSGSRGNIRLPEPIPVYILYFTAWADAGGNVMFYEDIYGRDQKLAQAFENIYVAF